MGGPAGRPFDLAFVDVVAEHPRLRTTALQTVGDKGWDGMMLLEVID